MHLVDGRPASEDAALERAAAVLRGARRVLAITGAGISEASGVPTYRGAGGLYDRGRLEEGMRIEEILSPQTFATRPELVWGHILMLEQRLRGASPNRAHEILAALERRYEALWTVTQNVDGFHRQVGHERVIEIHGNVRRIACTECEHEFRVPDFAIFEGGPLPPRCASCGGVLRPDVVLFGEALDPQDVSTLYEELDKGFDVIASIGTSSLFPYIVEPVIESVELGRPTIEINPGETEISELVEVKLSMPAVAALEALEARLREVTGEARALDQPR